jgi:hypothetical protein
MRTVISLPNGDKFESIYFDSITNYLLFSLNSDKTPLLNIYNKMIEFKLSPSLSMAFHEKINDKLLVEITFISIKS